MFLKKVNHFLHKPAVVRVSSKNDKKKEHKGAFSKMHEVTFLSALKSAKSV